MRNLIQATLFMVATALVATVLLASDPANEKLLQRGIDMMEAKGDIIQAIPLFQQAARSSDPGVAARALLYLAQAQERQDKASARRTYERIVNEFAGQKDIAANARQRLNELPSTAAPSTDSLTTRRLWSGSSTALGGVSPDGRYVIVDEFDVSGNLAVRDLRTGDRRRITNKGTWQESTEYAGHSRFFPDGKRIAFGWNARQEYQLRVIDLAGTNEKTIYASSEIEWLGPSDFSLDAKQVLCVIRTRNQTAQIAWIPVAGGAIRVLKTLPWQSLGSVGLSPDGRYIAYDAKAAGQTKNTMFLLASDGSKEVGLAEAGTVDQFAAWMPDGKFLLFMNTRTGVRELSALPVADGKATGQPVLVKADMGPVSPLGMTKSGALLYHRTDRRGDVYTASVDWEAGKLSKVESIVRNVAPDFGPGFSPDGKHLAYVAHLGSDLEHSFIVTHNLDTGDERRITPTSGLTITVQGGYTYSPDGKSFLVPGRDATHPQSLFAIDLASGESRLLFNKPGNQVQLPHWMPDGKSMLYRLRDQVQPKALLFIRDLESGNERQLRTGVEDAQAISAAVSGDGQLLAFMPINPQTPGDTPIRVMPITGGEPRTVVPSPSRMGVRNAWIYGWTPDNKRIIFRTQQFGLGPEVTEKVWSVSVDGGTPIQLALPDKPSPSNVRVHPDGGRIAYLATLTQMEVSALENLSAVLRTPKR